MIGYGIRNLFLHRQLSREFPQPPSDETMRTINSLMELIERRRAKDSPDLIEMREMPFLVLSRRGRMWRVLLLNDVVVASLMTGNDDPLSMWRNETVICARKTDVRIMSKHRFFMQKTWDTRIRLGKRKMRAYLAQNFLVRLEKWLEE
jgi:hypothetical protein